MPSNVPAARTLVEGVARRIAAQAPEEASLLRSALGLMTRDSPKRRVTGRHASCSDEIAQQIREYALNHPGRSYAEIALVFDVNIGRVSEALRDLR